MISPQSAAPDNAHRCAHQQPQLRLRRNRQPDCPYRPQSQRNQLLVRRAQPAYPGTVQYRQGPRDPAAEHGDVYLGCGQPGGYRVDSLAGTITRHYDGLNDLTQEVTPQGTVNYAYDNAGRRSTMQVVGQTQVAYTWDNANRLTAVAQGSQSVGLNYDNANRRTCLTLPNGVIATFGYDSDSRVTSLTYGTGGSCSSTHRRRISAA